MVCRSITRWLVAGAVATAALTACTSTTPSATVRPPPDPNPFRIGRPLVIPHGGGDGLYPEDTIYAYEHSLANGGDVVDVDVRTTADGIPIAFHDDALRRTTNGVGNVSESTYAQIAALDAGYNFTKAGAHPFRGQGIGVPTIEAVLERFPDTLVTLDLKDQRIEAVDPLCALLTTLHRTDDVYVGVDTTEQVDRFRSDCPQVRTSGTDADRAAARTARENHDPTYTSKQLVNQPPYLGSDGVPRVTADSLAFAHSYDTAVLTWVVDDPKVMSTLIDMGIDGIYTRRPDVMVALLRQKGLLP